MVSARAGRSWMKRLSIVLFTLPALVLFGGLVLLPMLLGVYTSLFKWNGFGADPRLGDDGRHDVPERLPPL